MPLALPKRFLLKKLRELLRDVHPGKRGWQAAKRSRAAFRVTGQPNIPALATAIEVWDLRKKEPTMPLWEIGQLLPRVAIGHKLHKDDRDRVAKKNVLAATVSRYLRRARRSIAAVERGTFP
jgi:hypothetical protein